jgi:hypothetical protein
MEHAELRDLPPVLTVEEVAKVMLSHAVPRTSPCEPEAFPRFVLAGRFAFPGMRCSRCLVSKRTSPTKTLIVRSTRTNRLFSGHELVGRVDL